MLDHASGLQYDGGLDWRFWVLLAFLLPSLFSSHLYLPPPSHVENLLRFPSHFDEMLVFCYFLH